jgi:hypothetical protein
MKFVLSIVFFLLIGLSLKAQQWAFGAHVGGGFANMKLDDNVLSDQVTIQKGPAFFTGSFGIQGILKESKDQEYRKFKPKPALLLEASLCRCGGNVEVISKLPSARRSFNELNYVQYQGNFRAMGMLSLKSLRVFFGPNFSYNFYNGVYVSDSETPQSADDQFKSYALGYEAGLGVGNEGVMLSMRYRGYFTDYGVESRIFPTAYRNNQIRMVLSVNFIDKNREKNSGSIFWK